MKDFLSIHEILQKDCLVDIISRSIPSRLGEIWHPENTVVTRVIPNQDGSFLIKIQAENTTFLNDDMALGYLVVPGNDEIIHEYNNLAKKRAERFDADEEEYRMEDHWQYLDREKVFIAYFPYDFRLFELPKIVDDQTVEQLIFGMPMKNTTYAVRNCTLKLLGYRPEKRATFHFKWSYTDGRDDLVFIGKLMSDFESAEARKEIGFMQASHHRSRGKYGFAFPQAVASLPEIRSYVETDEGEKSLHRLLDNSDCKDILESLGERIAILHGSNLAPEHQYLPEHELSLISRWTGYAKEYQPASAAGIDEIYRSLENLCSSLGESSLVPSNGAFCGKNLLIEKEEKYILLNWSSVTMAPPELDLGIVRTYLDEKGIESDGNINRFDDMWSGLHRSYCKTSGKIDDKMLKFFYSSRLLLAGLYRLFKPETEQSSNALFTRCREFIST